MCSEWKYCALPLKLKAGFIFYADEEEQQEKHLNTPHLNIFILESAVYFGLYFDFKQILIMWGSLFC